MIVNTLKGCLLFVRIGAMSNNDVLLAVQALKRGELVAFPTETVYGLGADATNKNALNRLYTVKGRPQSHPVIVHLASFEHISKWASYVPEEALILARAFCPGPLTFILKRSGCVLNEVTGGQDTVGLRIPAHPLALELLEAFGGGIAAPSANKFGKVSTTTADDVKLELGNEVSVVLDGGACPVGIESTIIDLSSSRIKVLRPGMIFREQIEEVLGFNLDEHELKIPPAYSTQTKSTDASQTTQTSSIRVPGGLPSHYAPNTPLKLLEGHEIPGFICDLDLNSHTVGLLHYSNIDKIFNNKSNRYPIDRIISRRADSDPHKFAQDLYSNIRFLDKSKSQLIIVETPPKTSAWTAILDRLYRASAKTN